MSYRNRNDCFNKKKRSFQLEPGLVGFLCTCNSKIKEKDCIREAYNILNEFADILYGTERDPKNIQNDKAQESTVAEKNEDGDIDDLLKCEIEFIKANLCKKAETKRFQALQSGANGIVFIRTTVSDPVNLAHTIMMSMVHVQKSKFLLRLLPVEVTCKAYLEDICHACDLLFDKSFTGDEKTFAVVYNCRNNNKLKRDLVIDRVAELVTKKNKKNKANLKQPQLAILIEVIRNICCISVVPDFYSLKKYNLVELAASDRSSFYERNL